MGNVKISAVAIAIVMALSACGGAEDHKAKYLERGKSYLAEQNYAKAAVELKNVLQIDPKDAQGHYYLALIEEKDNNLQRAFAGYQRAVELDPEFLEAKQKLAWFYVLVNELDQAEALIDELLAKMPEDPDVRVTQAALKMRQGDEAGAIAGASEIFEADPTHTKAARVLVTLYQEQANLTAIQEVLEKAIDARPKDIPSRLALAQVLMQQQQTDAVEGQLRQVIAIEPDSLKHRRTLASFYTEIGQLDNAEQTLRKAAQMQPEALEGYRLLAYFLATKRSPEAAMAELQSLIKGNPGLKELGLDLARLYLVNDKEDQASQLYSQLIDENQLEPLGLEARVGLAALRLKQEKQNEASHLVKEVLKEDSKNTAALFLQGRIGLLEKDAQKAIGAFRLALRDKPDSPEVLALLADAHLLNNEWALAGESLQKAVEFAPEDLNLRGKLVPVLLQAKDFDGALAQIDKGLELSPGNLKALQAKANVLAFKNDRAGLKETLLSIRELYPEQADASLVLGRLYMSEEKPQEARWELESVLEKDPQSLQALAALMKLDIDAGSTDRAILRARTLLQEYPDHPYAHQLLGELYLTQKQYDKAETELSRAVEVNPNWPAPYDSLGRLYLARKAVPRAIAILKKGLEVLPDNIPLSIKLAMAYSLIQDYDSAIALYERVLQHNPRHDIAANNLAALLSAHREDQQSLERALELASRFKDSERPDYLDTLGWIYYRLGELDQAIPLLEKAVQTASEVPLFRYHIGMALYRKGEVQPAKQHLTLAVQASEAFPGIEEARYILKTL